MASNLPHLDAEITDIVCRLHALLDSSQYTLCNTEIHDLTCFVVHKLLSWSPRPQIDSSLYDLTTSGSVRNALVLYMLLIQGPTYFSHARLQYTTAIKLQAQMEHTWCSLLLSHGSLTLWLLTVGMVASEGIPEYQWFTAQAGAAAEALRLQNWSDVVYRLRDIVWLDSIPAERLFQQNWYELLTTTAT